MVLHKYTKYVSNQTVSTVRNTTKIRIDRICFEAVHREGFNGIGKIFFRNVCNIFALEL